ncbi:MAG TPA: 50S ribosomal protein L29 [Gemmatimonadaceae bacterium]
MTADEIRELTDEDIRSRLAELEEERFRLRFRGATQPLEDPLRLRNLRKDIARLNTVLRERTSPGRTSPERALTSSGK